MTSARVMFPALAALWLALVIVSLVSRSYLPIDETRYVTVAWNMWIRGDFLVPWLNGAPYSDKPPLLFWLMNLGWAVIGVNDWWPRVVPSLFALGSCRITWLLARKLWPEDLRLAWMACLILMSSALWAAFTTATMFDMLVTFFTLVGVMGILTAWHGRGLQGWALVGLAIGGGLLAKGPTILLQVLPLALLAPWWGGAKCNWRQWYTGLLSALMLGAAIALIWAIPAALHGGEKYSNAILWGQTADRVVNSFAHRRPFWWYLPLLPVMFFPWALWVPIWRGGLKLHGKLDELGVRMMLAWLFPVLIAMSLVSGKQMHYLLPVFPAFAMLAARAASLAGPVRRMDFLPLALAVLAVATGWLLLPSLAGENAFPAWVDQVPAWGGWMLAGFGLLLALPPSRELLAECWKISLFGILTIILLHLALIRPAGLAYDVRPLSARLKVLEDSGTPLAYAGRYHGTFNFLGRLKHSPDPISPDKLSEWFNQYPQGRAMIIVEHGHSPDEIKPEYMQPYQNKQIAIVNREQWMRWYKDH